MKKKINYGRQYIDKLDVNLVIKSLNENRITTGNYVNLFEKKIRDKFKCKYAYSCCNGTAGLHLAYLAINLKKDDIVLMPSVNFISSYSMAKQLGARIFLVDVDPITGQMTPEKILECIKLNKINKIKAIVTMYLGGYVENNINFYNLKKRLNCYLIEDACHAIGAKYKYKNKEHYIGSCKHSDICVFSFHPIKTITTGEGGAVITNSKFFSEKIKIFRNHGIIRNKKEYWKYNIKQMSFNYRLSDINCSLGIGQLSKLNKFINQRKKIFDEYRDKLKNFKEFVKINNYNNKINGFHLIILNINFNSLKSTKDEMFRFLNKHNIFPQYHYIPLYKFSFHKKKYFNKFEGTEEYYKKSISLPIYYDLKKNDLAYIIKVIKKFFRFSKQFNF